MGEYKNGEGLNLFTRGSKFRILRPLSASDDFAIAKQHTAGANCCIFEIAIPKNFWGARNISDISKFPEEKETLFPGYSLFEFKEKTEREGLTLYRVSALDKYDKVSYSGGGLFMS